MQEIVAKAARRNASRQSSTPVRSTLKGVGRLLALLLVGCCSTARAELAIDWLSMDGGGGLSSGGDYTLAGAIGQFDAGSMSGSELALEGGFWAGMAEPFFRPSLAVAFAEQAVIISWPLAAASFRLEQTANLNEEPIAWTAVPGLEVQTNGSTMSVTLPLTERDSFYRLRTP